MRLPHDGFDIENTQVLIEQGYPTVAPLLPELLNFLQDYNQPVAQLLAPFLCSIGEPLAADIRPILQGKDEVWKYWILVKIVAFNRQLANALKPELIRFAEHPTEEEFQEELHLYAHEILYELDAD